MIRRPYIPVLALLGGSTAMAGIYLGILGGLQGWAFAFGQLGRDAVYVLPIIIAFGIQAALYSILRLRLFVPVSPRGAPGAVMGVNGGTSTAAMVACCLHHAANVLPVLGLSAAAAFLGRYQRPFMQVSLAMNIAGIVIMLGTLRRLRQRLLQVAETR
jgi:hypothetical protein